VDRALLELIADLGGILHTLGVKTTQAEISLAEAILVQHRNYFIYCAVLKSPTPVIITRQNPCIFQPPPPLPNTSGSGSVVRTMLFLRDPQFILGNCLARSG
jgi:hypothetical protein